MESFEHIAGEMVDKPQIAAAVFQELNQKETEKIVETVYKAGFNARMRLAKMSCEETGIGVWEHKVLKNVLDTQKVYYNIRHLKTIGIISSNEITGITEIAQPLGPIFAIIPVTNPTSTILYKALICMKSRNPVIFSVHRNAGKFGKETVRLCYEAALKAGAPVDCIQIVPEQSRELTKALNPALTLGCGTGGKNITEEGFTAKQLSKEYYLNQ